MNSVRAYGWLWLLVALQIAIPASYYFVRTDKDDERFAWRMFSVVRQKDCRVRAFDEAREGAVRAVQLTRVLHSSWEGALERGRKRVIEAFLARRCEDATLSRASLIRRCRDVRGVRLPDEQYVYNCGEHRLSKRVLP